jgi:glycerophosphoryl diester phosphodiesterase
MWEETMSDQTNAVDPSSNSSRRWSKGLGCLVIVVAIPLLYYGLYFVLRGPKPANPQVIAHRGGRALAPENTLKAFQNAIALGVDWLELDVQRTQDGALVVIHDDTVDRTTNGTGAVRDLTLDQIRALDAGEGEKVPTFEEVLQLAKSAGIQIMPEAKDPEFYPGLGTEMAQAVTQAGDDQQTAIQSFDPGALAEVLAVNPQIKLAPLFGLWQFSLKDPQPSGSKMVLPMGEMVLLDPWMIKQAHDLGRQVFVWFGMIENPLVMRILLAMGVDGLIVDDPVALQHILGR